MSRAALLALLLVLAVATGARLLLHPRMAAAADTFAPLVDSEAYLLQALRVADGAPLVEGVTFQAPLYPWLLGWTLRLAGVPGATGVERVEQLDPAQLASALAAGRALQALLGVLTAGLVFLLGRWLFGTAAGTAAGLLAALYAPLLAYEGHLLKVGLSVLPLLAALLAAGRALRREGAVHWVPVGVCLGLGALVRGNLHLVTLLGAAVLLVAGWRRAGAWRGVLASGALLAGVGLALAPVVLRNSVVAGRPVLSTAAGGTAFWLCNHAGNDTGLIQHVPGNRQVPRYELDDWRRLSEAETGRPMSPGEISRLWFGKAVDDILDDPLGWLHVELRKLGLLFSRYEAPDNVSVRLAEEAVPLLRASPSRWSLVMPLALGGLVLAWTRRRRLPHPALLGALLVAMLGYAASLLLFIVTARFRMPLPVLALLPAGYLLVCLPELVRGGGDAPRRRVAAALLAGLLLQRASEGPLGPLTEKELASHQVTRLANRAQVALRRGDAAAARADLERALREGAAHDMGAAVVFTGLARLDLADAVAAAERGDEARAAQLLALVEQALALALRVDREHLPALALRVQALLAAGRRDDARAALADYDAAVAALGGDAGHPEPEAFARLREDA